MCSNDIPVKEKYQVRINRTGGKDYTAEESIKLTYLTIGEARSAAVTIADVIRSAHAKNVTSIRIYKSLNPRGFSLVDVITI